jgi:hypothetical protein
VSNRWSVNITCPRCRFVGDVEEEFPCGHEAEIAQLRADRDMLVNALELFFDNDGIDCECERNACFRCVARAALSAVHRDVRCPAWSNSLAGQCDLPKGHDGMHVSSGDGFARQDETTPKGREGKS